MPSPASSRLAVRVTPGARADEIAGWQSETLRVRVTAPPERGKANEAVCRLISRALGLRAGGVSVVRGAASREKVLAIEGLDAEEVRRRLGAPIL